MLQCPNLFYKISREFVSISSALDSLTELKGSSSHQRKKSNGQEVVPKFSLSDDSDDELKSHG